MFRKGIILAGGSGTRLYPLTRAVSKQLLPIYDKPMIYYPLSTLMLAGIREILLITTPEDIGNFERLLGDGTQFGVSIQLRGPADARRAGAGLLHRPRFRRRRPVRADPGRQHLLRAGLPGDARPGRAASNPARACSPTGSRIPSVTASSSSTLDGTRPVIEEKPVRPKSHYAVTGLYFYDNRVVDVACPLETVGPRGELEITDVNRVYLERGPAPRRDLQPRLRLARHRNARLAAPGRELCRDDRGTAGLKIACLEEIAYRQGFIDAGDLERLAQKLPNDYGRYLKEIAKETPPPSAKGASRS